MTYFRQNEPQQSPVREDARKPAEQEGRYAVKPEYQDRYDDGFDELNEQEEYEDEELTLTEKKQKANRIATALHAGNVTAVITGAILILILLGFLMTMISFVLNDINRSFTLFQTKF